MGDDLLDRLRAFLFGLPETIRADVMFLVLGYARQITSASMPSDAEAVMAAARNWLECEDDPTAKAGTVIIAAALLDYILVEWLQNADRLPRAVPLLPESIRDSASTQRMLAGHPLRVKHMEQAQAEWSALRGSVFTHGAIAHYSTALNLVGIAASEPAT